MTLCIAATTFDNDIVLVSDAMLSSSDLSFSTDIGTMKLWPVGGAGRWNCMFAGSPSTFRKVWDRAHDHEAMKAEQDADNVAAAFRAAFRAEFVDKVECELLSNLGFASLREFRQIGRKELGPTQYNRIVDQIRSLRLDTIFLLAGYDGNDGRIFTVDESRWAHRIS